MRTRYPLVRDPAHAPRSGWAPSVEPPPPTGETRALPDSLQRDLEAVNDAEPREAEPSEHHAPEITFDEQFYPARPRRFRPSARRSLRRRIADKLGGETIADSREYVEWLVGESMLSGAERLAAQLFGCRRMWEKPFAHPGPRAAVVGAPGWLPAV